MGGDVFLVSREDAIRAMAKAMSSEDGFMQIQDRDYTKAKIAFDALVRRALPRDAVKNDSGSWWQPTPTGEKMINKITVTI